MAAAKKKKSPASKTKKAAKKTPATKAKAKPSLKERVTKFAKTPIHVATGVSALDKLLDKVQSLFGADIHEVTAAIKADHDSLRNFLKILKDTDADMTERRRAYRLFSDLLKSHSKAEEKAVYVPADELTGHELHIKIAEGYVEHQLADDLMARIEKAKDPTEWSAHANVLSEILEHHLDEEERDLLPLIRQKADANLNDEMMNEYVAVRERTQKIVREKNSGILAQ